MHINAETVPQLTYDIIARILPGFFFISLLILSATTIENVSYENGVKASKLLLFSYIDFQISFMGTVLILIISYLIGWSLYNPDILYKTELFEKLRPFLNDSFSNYEKGSFNDALLTSIYTHRNLEEENKKEQENSVFSILKEMYHLIRLKNPSAGQRLVKLRAEVRMWEAITASAPLLLFCCLLFTIASLFMTLSIKITPELAIVNSYWAIIKTGIIVIVITAISILYNKSKKITLWAKYWKNIISHYYLISKYNIKPIHKKG